MRDCLNYPMRGSESFFVVTIELITTTCSDTAFDVNCCNLGLTSNNGQGYLT
jgi:hypothetical protein